MLLRPARVAQAPIGCQTVLNSMSAVISYGLWAAAQNGSASGAAMHPLHVLGGQLLDLGRRRSAGTPVTSIAFTSMWPASHGTSSATLPVRMLTTPPGTSDVASTSASDTAGSGARSLAITTAVLPETIAGARRDDQTQQRLVLRRHDPDHAGGLRDREVEVRPGHRVRGCRATCCDLVGPPRVPDPPVDRGVDAAVGIGCAGVGELGLELLAAALHQLGHAVQDLAAVVGRHAGPPRLRGAGRRTASRRSLREACAA